MKNIKPILFFILLLFCWSCNNDDSQKSEDPGIPADSLSIDSNKVMMRPSAIDVELSTSDGSVGSTNEKAIQQPVTRVVIHTMEGYGADSSFARRAAEVLENAVNSAEFKNAVMAETFAHTQGLSPQQVYEKIMQAKEIDGPGGSDGVIDLRLRVITAEQDGARWMRYCEPNSSTGTIGIDGGGSGIAAVCPQWLRSTAQANRPAWLAAHFIHEYMHILNFTHPNKKSRSVPYKIHAIIERIAQ